MQAATTPRRNSSAKNVISNEVPQNHCLRNIIKTEPSFYHDEEMEQINSNQFIISSLQCGGQKNQVEPEDSVVIPSQSSDCSNELQISQPIKAEPSLQDQDEEKFSLADIVGHFQSSASTQGSNVETVNRNTDLFQNSIKEKLTKPCNICSKSFTASKILTVHEKRTRVDGKQYPCEQCSKLFSTSESLVRHKRIHTNEKPYSCDQCNKSFRESGKLVVHKRIHTGDNPNSCTLCSKSFNYPSTLAEHMRTHTGEKPYSCDQCDKSFSTSRNLVRHKRTHSGEKPYSCALCSKSFCTSWELVRHKRMKPYSCDLCNKFFCYSWELVKHKQTHAGEKPCSSPV